MQPTGSKRERGHVALSPSGGVRKRTCVVGSPAGNSQTIGAAEAREGGRLCIGSGLQTPQKQPIVFSSDHPSIHGSALKRASPRGFTPQKLKDTVSKLPDDFAALLELFGGLQTIYILLKASHQACTFQTAKRPVEEASGRTFTRKHLLQMKTVFPEALDISERIMVPHGLDSAGKQLCTTIIMPLLKGANAAIYKQDVKQQFADLLLARVRRHQAVLRREASAADGPALGVAALSGNLNTIPDIPAAELPRPIAALPGLCSPSTPTASAKAGTPSSSARKPPLGPRPTGTFAKRLNFAQPGQLNVCASEALAGIPRVGAAAVGLEVSDVERVAAAELRAQSIEGRLPITLEQLEKLDRNAEQKASHFSPVAKAAKVQAGAESRLARSHLQLRCIFGTKGPNVLPRKQIVQKMLGKPSADASHMREIEAALDLLLERAPEFVTQELRPNVGYLIRVNRAADDPALRAKLAPSPSS